MNKDSFEQSLQAHTMSMIHASRAINSMQLKCARRENLFRQKRLIIWNQSAERLTESVVKSYEFLIYLR